MIHILYRLTENLNRSNKNRPQWFSYEKSLNNLLTTITDRNDVTFHLLYDGVYKDNDPRIHKVEQFLGGSDKKSFFYAWDYAQKLKLEDNDLVYFCENDYLHTPGWVDKILNLYLKLNFRSFSPLNIISL